MLGRQLSAQDLADVTPSEAMLADYAAGCRDLKATLTAWRAIQDRDLATFDALLAGHGLATPPPAGRALAIPTCGVGAVRARRARP